MSEPEDGSCFAKGQVVWKSSRKTDHGDGKSGYTLGFPVCEVSEFVDAEDVAKCLTAGQQFGGKFSDLADHLGCDPAELEGLDLVAWLEAFEEIARDLRGPSDFCTDINSRSAIQLALETARQALAQLPERKT